MKNTVELRRNLKIPKHGRLVMLVAQCWLRCKQNELTSVLPGMIGLPANNSARMQPALHISIAGPYSVAPSKSSGALYQRVTTRLVKG
jgi:hypothetical protein